ncbi:D-2-hydroxyacid dehydrogenase [Bacillus sp. ISL-47]|uniref:D-2-hydroxyacid dehydrogenase n=1 Tax=Bacillus sp. ISL-47 TaxID=2819130 RepID=UPI001BE77283|nr:D-2-hydroxyacid dehydrogenase [Bacillus sp. ISL-47]MBT2688891.1 D-2-hydroxyacid dehydrogenase [Bacillus sp. ISL-47]MBT2709084.1 D-2-hydroxyacid dehydrogenase [Pseudomonas sp. ISL-84]
MTRRTCIITHELEQSQLEKIREMIPDWQLLTGKDPVNWLNYVKEAEVIAGWKKDLKEPIQEGSTNLRWFQSWSAGVDSLPLAKMEANGIQITSANGVHANPISETIFALMLALTRKIHTYVKNQQSKTWHHASMKLEIHNKTIGIIGVGAIGKETAKIAKAFGMKVVGVRHSGKPEEYVDEMYTSSQLNDVLPQCDYVAVTLPLTNETRQLFGAEQFSLMKESAFFINIGRGEIVVENDLIAALQAGKIAGAGLDVFEKEPLGEDSPLWELENVIVTPHTAGSTEHYTQRVIEDIFIPNLKNYINGETPAINLVDYQKGY